MYSACIENKNKWPTLTQSGYKIVWIFIVIIIK